MFQYLMIQLDDTSTSYCHYPNTKSERRLISLDDLKAGVLFGMKENLMLQYVLPDFHRQSRSHAAADPRIPALPVLPGKHPPDDGAAWQ